MVLCLNSSISNLRKLNIDLHEKIVEPRDLDEVLSDIEVFEKRVRNFCVPVGFNAIREYFDKSYMSIAGFSVIQDYICKRKELEKVHKILLEMKYEEISNPFIIEVECSDGKKESINSCLEEKIFRKRINGSEIYISIFPENSIYYRIKGKKILESRIIFPNNPKIFTILSKLYRYDERDFLDLLVLSLTLSEILREIDERAIKEYISEYSAASNIEKNILLDRISKNLLEMREAIKRVEKYLDAVSRWCCYSLEDFKINISNNKIGLYLLSKINRLDTSTGLTEIERLIEIIKNLKENRN